MVKILNILLIACSILGVIFGDIEIPFLILLGFMVCDIITGVLSAIMQKNVNSEKMRAGGIHKLLIFIVLCVASMLDRLCGTQWAVRNICIYYYILQEGLSIVENLGKCGVKYPEKIKQILIQLGDKNNGT